METAGYVSEDSVIFATSDWHLGWNRARPRDVNKFLDYSIDEIRHEKLDGFVVNGDVVDDWRGYIGRILWQNSDVVEKLKMLKEKLRGRCSYVYGNHDYCAKDFINNSIAGKKLPSNDSQFEFRREFTLKTGKTKYIFMHGDQFDPMQTEFLYEHLCNKTGDHLGGMLSVAWMGLNGLKSLYKEFLLRTFYRSILKPPEQRKFKEISIADIVKENAKKFIREELKEGEKLICGHTHVAEVDNEARYANCGAWVEGTPNTFLRIKGDNVKLEEF